MCCGQQMPHLYAQAFYLIFQNLFIFSEGEHLYREALQVWRDCNPGVTHDRMEDGHIAVITVLTASGGIKHALAAFKPELTFTFTNGRFSDYVMHYLSTMMSQLGTDVRSSSRVAQQFSKMSSNCGSVDCISSTSKYRGCRRYFTTG